MTTSSTTLIHSFAALSDALPTPLMLLDRAGTLRHVNPPAALALRRSADALVGRRLWDIVSAPNKPDAAPPGAEVQPGPLAWTDPATDELTEAQVVALGDLLALTWTDGQAAGVAILREQILSEVTSALVSVLDSAEVVRVVIQASRRAMGAYGAVVYLLSSGGTSIRLLGASGYGEVPPQWSVIDLQQTLPVTDGVRTAAHLFLDQQAYSARYPNLLEQTITRSSAALLLVAGQRTLGVLGLSFDRNYDFSENERASTLR